MTTAYYKMMRWSLITVLATMLAGCGLMNKNHTSSQKQVNVYMKTGAANNTGALAGSSGMQGSSSQATTQDSTLKLTSVSMFVKQMMLKGTMIDTTTGGVQDSMSHGDDDMWDHYRANAISFSQKNFVVNLPLNQDSVMVSTSQVPSGKYYALFMHISRPDSADSANYPNFVSGSSWKDRYSLIVKGTYKGQNFVYKSHRNFIIGTPIYPPVTVTDSTAAVNVKMLVNTSDWFVNPWNGKTLDPTDSTNFRLIDWTIMKSFYARCGEHDYRFGFGFGGWGHHHGDH